jgi:hypothetical protein
MVMQFCGGGIYHRATRKVTESLTQDRDMSPEEPDELAPEEPVLEEPKMLDKDFQVPEEAELEGEEVEEVGKDDDKDYMTMVMKSDDEDNSNSENGNDNESKEELGPEDGEENWDYDPFIEDTYTLL